MSAAGDKRRRGDDATPAAASPAPAVAASVVVDDGPAAKRVKTEPAAADGTATTAAAKPKKRRWDTQDATTTGANGSAATAAAATPATPSPAAPATSAASGAAGAPLTPAERALAMQKSIAARLAAAKIPKPAPGTVAAAATSVKLEAAAAHAAAGLPPSAAFASPSVIVKAEPSWQPLRLDAQGRQIDAQGQLVQLARPTELKVNARAVQEARAAAAAAAATGAGAGGAKMPRPKIATTIIKEEGQSKFHDPRMSETRPAERKPRALELVRPGKYVQMAATMRMKQLEADMQAASRAAKAAVGATAATAAAPSAVTIVKPGPIPAVEWWDTKLLTDPTAGYASEVNLARVTSYIYHPVELASLTAAPPPPPMPVLLTKAERKKIKRRTKREMLKEKADRVRQGLEAPAEPKMRLQNLMNVLLNDTVADPSAMEAKVRAQMAERVTGHVEANAARKLTPEQKAEKRRRKYAEDTSAEVHVAVYRAGELGAEGGKARYQIDVNAQQWNLSGLAVLHPECNVVIAEGGPKAQRRFRRLMLHRIRWRKKAKSAMEQAAAGAGEEEEEEEEDESDSEDDDEDVGAAGAGPNATRSRTGACALVWTGVVPKARFATAGGAGGGRFTFEAMRSEALARNHLAKLGMEAYWDMCRAYRPDTEL